MQLAEQSGTFAEAKSVPKKTRRWKTFRTLVRVNPRVPVMLTVSRCCYDILRLLPLAGDAGITELEYEFYRRKTALTYRLHGEAWREKVTERPVAIP